MRRIRRRRFVNPFFATWLEANEVSKRVEKTWNARCESVLQASRRWKFEVGERVKALGPEVGGEERERWTSR